MGGTFDGGQGSDYIGEGSTTPSKLHRAIGPEG